MRILGLDPSTTASGWAVLEQDGALVASGVVKHKGEPMERVVEHAWQLAALYVLYQPTFVFSEAPTGHRSGKVTRLLSQLSGAILFAFYVETSRKLLVNYLQPSEVRKTLGVKGIKKDDALAHIVGLLRERGIPFAEWEEDEMEAWAVAEAGRLEVARWTAQVAGESPTTEEVKAR